MLKVIDKDDEDSGLTQASRGRPLTKSGQNIAAILRWEFLDILSQHALLPMVYGRTGC